MTIKVFCCYTKAHEPLLRDYFLPSIPNDVQVIAVPLEIEGEGDFLSKEFIDCINRKMSLIQDSLEQEKDALIIWTDIDIIFFKDFAREVVHLMNEAKLDIAFQKEGFGEWDNEVNAGFVIMRTNQRVREFYRRVSNELKRNPEKNEQPVINEFLKNGVDLRWKMLPTHFAARSHGWPPQEAITLYHANVTVGEGGVRRKISQFQKVRNIRGESSVRICLVSPEVIGPRRNSGIGTHAFHFLQLLAADPDVDVTFLLTAEIHVAKEGGWESWFKEQLNVNFVHLNPLPHPYPEVGWFNYWFNLRSLQIFNYLRRQNFKVIHFQDLNGDGFVCHQARKTGLAFQGTVFTTMLNGPAKWAREGMKAFAQDMVYESMLNFVERYSLENSDVVVAPSNYAYDYAEKECGWKLSANRELCPYMLEVPSGMAGKPVDNPAIIFFGRLETRKGINLFLKSLKFLDNEDFSHVPRNVLFIGSHGDTPQGRSEVVIPEYFETELAGWDYAIHSDFDQPECIEFLSSHKESVIVLPSVAETLGYVAIECFELGLNVIGANTGAFPELFASQDRLFANNPRAIAAKINEAFAGTLSPPRSKYDAGDARQKWISLHRRCLELIREMQNSIPGTFPKMPLVSICLPYFNYGIYIRDQIQSILGQTYINWELIFINDGSTDPESRQVFKELMGELQHEPRVRFYEQENRGLCITRNKAASLAKGDYLVFCDADNISKPQMLARLVHAIQTSKADCVTCHFEKFRIESDGSRVQLDYYTPVGACVEAGPYVDPYGDVNGIILKEVFEKLGGFRHVPNTASEDWEFFSEMCLSGYTLEVIPEDLFEYREHAASNMRTSSFYDTRLRTLYPYLKRMNKMEQDMLITSMGAWETNILHRRKTGMKIQQLETGLGKANQQIDSLQQSLSEKEKELAGLRINQMEKDMVLQTLDQKIKLLECRLDKLRNNFFKRLVFRLLDNSK